MKKSTTKAAPKTAKKPVRKKSEPLANAQRETFARKLAEAGGAHGSKTRAAREAGYSPKSSGKIGFNLSQNREIQARVKELMEEGGITRQSLRALFATAQAETEAVIARAKMSHSAFADETVLRAVARLESIGDKHAKMIGAYQRDGENETERESRRRLSERAVAALIEGAKKDGISLTREEAIKRLAVIEPEIREYLN